jgi:hypothetical protein
MDAVINCFLHRGLKSNRMIANTSLSEKKVNDFFFERCYKLENTQEGYRRDEEPMKSVITFC